MKIMMKDSWLGKLLNYPTNICIFAWGVMWRVVGVACATAVVIGVAWLWCMAFYDGFISGHANAATAGTVWVFLTALLGVVAYAAKDWWHDHPYVKRFRALVVDVCPVIEWDRDAQQDD